MEPSSSKRSSKGKQKIEIKLINDYNARQVCFTKRRNGIFKKANELSIMCGAHVAIIVFSPGGKPFSFGHPSVEAILNRFINGGAPLTPLPPPDADAIAGSCLGGAGAAAAAAAAALELEHQASAMTVKVEEKRKRKAEIEAALRATNGAVDLEVLGVDRLERLKVALGCLQQDLAVRAYNQMALEALAQSQRHFVGCGNAHAATGGFAGGFGLPSRRRL